MKLVDTKKNLTSSYNELVEEIGLIKNEVDNTKMSYDIFEIIAELFKFQEDVYETIIYLNFITNAINMKKNIEETIKQNEGYSGLYIHYFDGNVGTLIEIRESLEEHIKHVKVELDEHISFANEYLSTDLDEELLESELTNDLYNSVMYFSDLACSIAEDIIVIDSDDF